MPLVFRERVVFVENIDQRHIASYHSLALKCAPKSNGASFANGPRPETVGLSW